MIGISLSRRAMARYGATHFGGNFQVGIEVAIIGTIIIDSRV